MNTNYSPTYSTSIHPEAVSYSAAQALNERHVKQKASWISKIQWRSVISRLFCPSILVGLLLASLSMPFPAWLMTGAGLFVIATPEIDKAVADMMLTTFTVLTVGILWHSLSLVSGFSLPVAFLAYGAITVGLAIAGIVLLIVISSALMAANGRSKFLDTNYFRPFQTQSILTGISLSGLTLGYWLVTWFTTT
jgi:hypothetical protein